MDANGIWANMLLLLFNGHNIKYHITHYTFYLDLSKTCNIEGRETLPSPTPFRSSLKCTTNMDKLNKIALSDETLHYRYKGDRNIPVGILGMVDDTLGVSNWVVMQLKRMQ